jgi:GNAT superfamily N-acetyltransferase
MDARDRPAERRRLVAESDGGAVAYAWLRDGFLGALYVHPSYQRRGIGGQLLSAVKQRADGGFDLWVFEANTGAIRFYERHGATSVRTTDGSGNEERLPDRLMRFC